MARPRSEELISRQGSENIRTCGQGSHILSVEAMFLRHDSPDLGKFEVTEIKLREGATLLLPLGCCDLTGFVILLPVCSRGVGGRCFRRLVHFV